MGALLPQGFEEWMRSTTDTLRRHTTSLRSITNVPVGGMVLLAAGADVPPRWLLANGSSFDPDVWPDLADQLGATTTPTLANISGARWIVRAG